MKKLKFTIIMPTYNDSDTIEKSIMSLLNQNYLDWELIIIDDGSTDETSKVVSRIKKRYDKNDKIKYYYQTNKDQLNAIKTAIPYITGDYVYILHSDDLLNDETLIKANDYLIQHSEFDAIISNLDIIDANDKITGEQIVHEYKNKNYTGAQLLLWLGRNLFVDPSFAKVEVFKKQFYENYLTWNCPFWINTFTGNMLNVKKVKFNFFRYRVYENNYINNVLGKLCVVNGELRVMTNLMKIYYIPFYRLQYYLFRLINKLGFNSYYIPFYKQAETKNKFEIIDFALKKRFSIDEINNNLYLKSIYNFYFKKNNRTIKIGEIDKNIPVYYGCDLRVFNKKILNNELESFYINLLHEMEKGFNIIEVDNIKTKEKMEDICKFLSIYQEIKIIVK